jgi:hypothetical protein
MKRIFFYLFFISFNSFATPEISQCSDFYNSLPGKYSLKGENATLNIELLKPRKTQLPLSFQGKEFPFISNETKHFDRVILIQDEENRGCMLAFVQPQSQKGEVGLIEKASTTQKIKLDMMDMNQRTGIYYILQKK